MLSAGPSGPPFAPLRQDRDFHRLAEDLAPVTGAQGALTI